VSGRPPVESSAMAISSGSVPPWLRRPLGRLRRDLIRRLGGTLPARGLTYDQLVSLLLPGPIDPSIRAAVDAASEGDLGAPTTIRRMLGAVEQQVQSTPFVVRLGPDDVTFRDVGPVRLALDAADASVSRQMESGSYEPHMTAIFEQFCAPGMTAVDVGANIGYFTLLASVLVGESGHVVAVEPNSENVRLLLASLGAAGCANVTVLPVGCDTEAGWSLFTSHVGGNGGLTDRPDILAWPVAVIPVFPLDDLIQGGVDFLKLDVEGAEGRAVAGAQRILESCRPIVTSEFSVQMLSTVSRADPLEYLDQFSALGYDIHLVDRASGEPRRYRSAASLLDDWGPDPYRIEDLVFLPS
jgi:FkbM family methyltransferase